MGSGSKNDRANKAGKSGDGHRCSVRVYRHGRGRIEVGTDLAFQVCNAGHAKGQGAR